MPSLMAAKPCSVRNFSPLGTCLEVLSLMEGEPLRSARPAGRALALGRGAGRRRRADGYWVAGAQSTIVAGPRHRPGGPSGPAMTWLRSPAAGTRSEERRV